MRNVNKILLLIVVVLLIALVGVLVWKIWLGGSDYYAVYLRTGDLYFGKLTTFPNFGLSDVYMLQVNSQDKQNPVSVQKFSKVFWGPENFININRDDVVWYTQLNPQGQLAQLIAKNPDLVPSANAPASGQVPATGQTPAGTGLPAGAGTQGGQ